jgi:hypothetical protein
MGKVYKQTSSAAQPAGKQYGDIVITKDGKVRGVNQSGAVAGVNADQLNGKAESALSVGNAAKLGNKTESQLSVASAANATTAANASKLGGQAASYYATKAALDAKAPISNPSFTGTVNVSGDMRALGDVYSGAGKKLVVRGADSNANLTVDAEGNIRWMTLNSATGSATTEGRVRLRGEGIHCVTSDGSAYTSIYATSIVPQSSKRFKKNIKPLDIRRAEKLLDAQAVTFNYKKEYGDEKQEHTGFIAEDMEAICPEAVHYDNGEIYGIDYTALITPAIVLVQLQHKEIEALKSKNAGLEARLEKIEKVLGEKD